MPRSFKSRLIGQTGEYLVVAELGRRNIIATPFAGNVPDIDILAYSNGIALPIQVKTVSNGTWQFDASRYLRIDQEKDRQRVAGKSKDIDPHLICVLVRLGEKRGEDKYFVLTVGEIQRLILKNYCEFLKKHSGVRPSNPLSTHTMIPERQLMDHLDKWSVIEHKLLPE